MVADQAKTGFGGVARAPAPDEKGACPFLKRLDALGDGRRGNVQIDCRKVKGSTAMNRGKGGKLGGVEHKLD